MKRYEEHYQTAPGFYLRPRFSWDTRPDAPAIIGGKPQLPANMEWPDGLSFYAQIHLDQIERQFSIDGQEHEVNGLPERGTLFIFLPLASDAAYDGPAKVLYTSEEVSELPEREPPEPFLDLRLEEKNWASYWLDVVGLSSNGQLLYRQHADLIPGLTATYATDLSKVDKSIIEDVFRGMDKLRLRHVKQALKRYPSPERPAEQKPDRETRFSQHIPRLNEARMTWRFIFEWCRQFQIEGYFLGLKRMKPFLEGEQDGISMKQVQALFQDRRTEVEKTRFSDKLSVDWRTFFGRSLPKDEGKFDEQAKEWMRFAQNRKDTLEKEHVDAFLAMLDRIAALKTEVGDFIGLLAVDGWYVDHDMDAGETRKLAGCALRDTEKFLNLGPEDELPASAKIKLIRHEDLKEIQDPAMIAAYWDAKLKSDQKFSGLNDYRVPPQILGLHDARESLRDELAETHIPLLQIRDSMGTQIENLDGIFELWIKPEAMAGGDFSKVDFVHMFS
ncbi:MAG: DUF1963 domain-containing protein [Tateyamaria sp.]|uniref:hypothetical protein n=1 Tax=Tateyamaria sp. TaxID=1929288 RepID=UPI00329DA467